MVGGGAEAVAAGDDGRDGDSEELEEGGGEE